MLMLVVLGIALIFFELLFGSIVGLDIVFLGVSFVLGGLSGFFSDSALSMVAISISFYIVYLLFLRQHMRRRIMVLLQRSGMIDTIIGKEVTIVDLDKKNKKARVLLDGELWEGVYKKPLNAGKSVFVVAFKENTLELEEDTG